jgi:hypothetical protein
VPTNFQVEGRNNYYAIDQYEGDRCIRHINSFETKGKADAVCNDLNWLAMERNSAIKLLQKAQAALPDAWIPGQVPKELVEEIDLFLLKHK